LAPVTLATRADEAGGPPFKFYELPNNLARTVELHVVEPKLSR
jgi:hypothetical protein